METSYDSITERVSSRDFPAGSLKVGSCTIPYGAYPPTDPPVSVTRLYRPYVESHQIYDPTKGRKFSSLKKDGAILFSDYSNSLITETYDIHSREKCTHYFYRLLGDCLSTPPVCSIGSPQDIKTSWTENDDFSSLSNRLSVFGRNRSYYDEEVENAISSTQQAAFTQALNAYDLLTELGELQETAAYLLSKVKEGTALISKFADKDPNSWKKGRRSTPKTLMKSSDAFLRKLGGRWMEYRYAIMPLLYSFQDISKVLNEKAFRYQSDRSRQKISLDFDPGTPLGDESLSVRSTGEIVVRSLTKARYDAGALQRLISVVGMNPFRSAWELVPLSFVVDWFLNVGDAITSLTGIDYSSERLGVTSVRESSIFSYEHRDHFKFDFTRKDRVNSCGQVPVDLVAHYDKVFVKDVAIITRNTYVRTVWRRPSPKIIFDPFLNWKRFLDGLVLGYQPTKKLLRSLK